MNPNKLPILHTLTRIKSAIELNQDYEELCMNDYELAYGILVSMGQVTDEAIRAAKLPYGNLKCIQSQTARITVDTGRSGEFGSRAKLSEIGGDATKFYSIEQLYDDTMQLHASISENNGTNQKFLIYIGQDAAICGLTSQMGEANSETEYSEIDPEVAVGLAHNILQRFRDERIRRRSLR